MNVETGTETPIFLFWEYFCFEIWVFCLCSVDSYYEAAIGQQRWTTYLCNPLASRDTSVKSVWTTTYGFRYNGPPDYCKNRALPWLITGRIQKTFRQVLSKQEGTEYANNIISSCCPFCAVNVHVDDWMPFIAHKEKRWSVTQVQYVVNSNYPKTWT